MKFKVTKLYFMSMSFTKIYIHVTWTTKYRQRILNHELMDLVIEHIKAYAVSKGIHIIEINGFENHIHMLLRLKSSDSLRKIMNLIKGESSHWINKSNLFPFLFRWQYSYAAFSVSLENVTMIRNYIRKQNIHHQTR